MKQRILTLENYIAEALPTKEVDPSKFPDPGTPSPSFFTKGHEDGELKDDVVKTKPVSIPAKMLSASQDAVYLGKALGMAIGGVEGGDLEAVISKENRILDGHHRWAATMFNNPDAKINGAKSELTIGDLIPVLRQAGDAMGNRRGLPPSGGDVNIFDATISDVEDCVYRGKNMDPKYFNKDKAIAWYESKGKDVIQQRLAMIQKATPPAGAPPRSDMPKIEPKQVSKVTDDLNKGKIDVRAPYNEGRIPTLDQFITESTAY